MNPRLVTRTMHTPSYTLPREQIGLAHPTVDDRRLVDFVGWASLICPRGKHAKRLIFKLRNTVGTVRLAQL